MQTGYSDPQLGYGAGTGSPSWGRQYAGQTSGGQQLRPAEAALEFFQEYARERPEVVAMWAFGVGFILAWKLKPW